MSRLLEQAIIDADALKDAAIKNAELAVIEKYSKDIKEAVNRLLEQDEELPTDEEEGEFAEQVPLAATDGEELCPCPDDEEEIEIDFDELSKRLEAEEELEAGEMADREEFAGEELEELEEGVIIDEEMLQNILDEVVEDVDEEVELNEEELEGMLDLQKDDEELEEATKTSDTATGKEPGRRVKNINTGQLVSEEQEEELVEETDESSAAERSLEELSSKYKDLKEENEKFKNLALQLKKKLNKVNLSNAKLLYTNRILNSDSLNERQKNKIVETITKSTSVEETKTIFETLQSAIQGASSNRAPKSLNEVVNKRSSAFLPRREVKQSNSFADRMQILAGIKQK